MSSLSLTAQKSGDIGLFLGGSYYMGEINRIKLYNDLSPAFGLVYRRNFNPHYSAKFSVKRAVIEASDLDFPKSIYQLRRNASFSNSPIWDFAGQLEFNFLEIVNLKGGNKFSPFVDVGIALFTSEFTSGLNFAIPFGVGVKYKFAKKWEIDLDWSYRKTFTDNLDGVSAFSDIGLYEYRQLSQANNNDWYSITGITIYYNLRSKKRCPAY